MTTPTTAPAVAAPAPVARPQSRAGARRRITFDPTAKFGPVSGGIAYGLGVLALGSAGDVADVAPWVGIVGGGALGLAASARAKACRHTIEAIAARYVAWFAAGLWLAAAWAWSPWQRELLLLLAAVTVAGSRLAFLAARKRTEAAIEAARIAAAEQLAAGDPRAAVWRDRLARVCKLPGCRIVGIEDWPDGNGYSVDVDPPLGGANWLTIAGDTVGLGADAGLPLGCEVQVGPGINQRATIIEVPTVDAFVQEQPADLDVEAASVLHGLDLGVLRNGGRAVIPIREGSTAIVGATGSGKTTLLHRMIKRIACCTDGMIGVTDMNEGALGVAWASAWWEGKAPYPVVAWIAGDAREALIMAEFGLGVAQGRKRRSGPLKLAANQSLMPIGNGAPGQPPPAWYSLFDESAELVGDDAKHGHVDGLDAEETAELLKKVMAVLAKTQRVARDAGVRAILSALRAIDGFLPTDLLTLCSNRVGLRLENDQDHGYLFGWTQGGKAGSTSDVIRKGGGKFSLGHGQPTHAFQAPNMTPRDIHDLSIRIAEAGIGPYDLSPEDIADGEAVAGVGAWTRRWERAAKLFPGPRIDFATQLPVDQLAQHDRTAAAPITQEEDPMTETPPTLDGAMSELAQASADLEAACQQAEADRADRSEGDQDDEDPELDARFQAIIAAGYAEVTTEPAAPASAELAPWRERVVELLKVIGPRGAGPSWLAAQLKKEGYQTNRQTISDFLRLESPPEVISPAKGKYAHRDASA